jgi:DNA-directed RNA polymerase specialized sigma24 family protein
LDGSGREKNHWRKRYWAAFLVGTALSSLGAMPAAQAQCEVALQGITRYCTACWRNARFDVGTWGDCTQEVLCRLLQRVRPEAWDKVLAPESEQRQELLRAIGAVKKQIERRHRTASLESDVADDQQPRRQELEIVSLALDGWSVQEIADRLGMPSPRVSDEKYKAIQKLRRELA